MTDKEVKRLSRADLLEMLIEATEELEATKAKLEEAEAKLKEKEKELKRLEKQLADMDEAGVDHAVLKLSCQQEWMGLDMCRYMNDHAANHAALSGGRMTALGVVPPIAGKEVFREIDRCLAILNIDIYFCTRR